MEHLILDPVEIEKKSMEIISGELQWSGPEEARPIVMRVIHATADFSFAETLHFSPGIVNRIRRLLPGCTLITDTQMACSGISRKACERYGVRIRCFMSDPDVAEEARARGVTRAMVAAEHALHLPGPLLLVCGNAPTFLLPLLSGVPEGSAVIGVPVGFVNVVEAKEALVKSGIPSIVTRGRRGGSTVAVAIVNALLYSL